MFTGRTFLILRGRIFSLLYISAMDSPFCDYLELEQKTLFISSVCFKFHSRRLFKLAVQCRLWAAYTYARFILCYIIRSSIQLARFRSGICMQRKAISDITKPSAKRFAHFFTWERTGGQDDHSDCNHVTLRTSYNQSYTPIDTMTFYITSS